MGLRASLFSSGERTGNVTLDKLWKTLTHSAMTCSEYSATVLPRFFNKTGDGAVRVFAGTTAPGLPSSLSAASAEGNAAAAAAASAARAVFRSSRESKSSVTWA